ncbi:NAD(P)H-binding protein [Streptosporangium carneum]|uniref:Nucleotide-diphosphate-sugar epimerase n=1 Tax=Streptosporangium carneum TaxID=47481 RepID=A0A9W6HXE2_9ACTN|nr:NAD(P)H-binding protein [Streptosporangium carneum]GLK08087.1 nucleotide-diphosphate-sugar epimerase [Streptosporangium carneum]
MTILVTGGRGLVAGTLLPLLHGKGHDVRVASSDPAKLNPPEGVPTVKCDLTDPTTFPAALDGVTSVFLYAEPAHIDAFVERAVDAGVRHIVLLSSSSVIAPDADTNPIARSHRAVEQALTASPIETTLLWPGAFASNALQWSWSIKSTGTIDLPYPNAHVDPIHEADIADVALAVLTDPALSGKEYHLTGPESLSFQEQLDRIAHVAGRPLSINVISEEAWKEEMTKYVPGEFADALLTWWREHDGSPTETTGTVEQVTGRPARSFATWAEDHADVFRN